MLVGSGEEREFHPARVEVGAAIQGWDISSAAAEPSAMSQSPAVDEAVKITLKRARSARLRPRYLHRADHFACAGVVHGIPGGHETLRIPDAGSHLVRGDAVCHRSAAQHPAGAPPPGAWIDVGLVPWVIVALVFAMVVYVIAWFRQVD